MDPQYPGDRAPYGQGAPYYAGPTQAPPGYPAGVPANRAPSGLARVGGPVSLIISACVVLGLLFVRIFSSILSVGGEKLLAARVEDQVATVFGWLGIVTILPLAAAVVFAHIAWASPAQGPRGRGIAGVALGVAYLLVILYFCRLVIAILTIVPAFEYHSGTVAANFFWWS
jgi:hypothetical protein